MDNTLLMNTVLELLEQNEVPDYVLVAPDFRTGNIIVSNFKNKLGFSISSPAIVEGYYREQFGPCLQRLVEIDALEAEDPIYYRPLYELRRQPTAFD